MTTPTWKSLIRFKDGSGTIRYGEPDADLKTAVLYDGNDILTLSRTNRQAEVVEVNLVNDAVARRLIVSGPGSVRP